MIAAAVTWAGIVIVLYGLVSAVRPWRGWRPSRRVHGLGIALIGLLVMAGAMAAPVGESTASGGSLLDEVMPRYQFVERHETRLDATASEVWSALHAVTADEIRLFRLLTWLRRMGRPGPESILDSPEHLPLLDVATRTTFRVLAEAREQELVVGTIVLAPDGGGPPESPAGFTALDAPGHAKAAMNFRIRNDAGPGSVLSTETRVFATDDPTRRRFAAYWRIILPGSDLIRRGWLAAIRKRVES